MNILITGCNGQLGNEMQRLEAAHPEHTWMNTDVDELDITNQLAVEHFVAHHKIDGIVNCAAYTAVDKAESNREAATTLNTVAPAYLAAAIEKRGGWMIHISTDYVFDGTHHTPYTETDTPCPDSVYGSTKLAGEMGVQKFCKNSMIIRTAWLYSTFGNNFVKTMIRLGNEKPELGVIFDQIGTPTYARDLAQVIMTAISHGIRPGIYHYSNEGVISWPASPPARCVRCTPVSTPPRPTGQPTACSTRPKSSQSTASTSPTGKSRFVSALHSSPTNQNKTTL